MQASLPNASFSPCPVPAALAACGRVGTAEPLPIAPPAQTPAADAQSAGKRYSTERLAAVLGLTKEAVRKRLPRGAAVSVSGKRGQEAMGWPLAALPAEWQRQISTVAAAKGFRCADDFLADDGAQPWSPPLPWGQVAERFQREAGQWRDALASILARQHELSPGEALAEAEANAARVFGKEVSPATVRRRFDAAAERDRNFSQWARLDIYLGEDAWKGAGQAAKGEGVPTGEGMASLADVFAVVKNPQSLTEGEAVEVWRALAQFTGERGAALAYAQRAVPGLVKGGPAAWTRALRRKTAIFMQDGGKGLADGRKSNGRTAKSLCPECFEKLRGCATGHDGKLALAYRRLILPEDLGGIRADGRGFCAKCAGLWRYDVRRNKSYVPESLRRAIMPSVGGAAVWRHGKSRARQKSPAVVRNPKDIGPGDVFEADDITWPLYFWTTDDVGKPFACMPECLLMIDRRTWYPLAFVMMAARIDEQGRKIKASYNSADIRRLVLRTHDVHGLPGELVFENGPWRSRLIDGPKVTGFTWNEWRQTEQGLNAEGILCGGRVRHTLPGNPRSKIIERMNQGVQDRLRPEDGFAGFNQRDYKPEVLNKFLAQVAAGKVHPQEKLHSFAAFRDLVSETLMSYAKEPHDGRPGRWLTDSDGRGLSPLEAWTNGIGGHPGIGIGPGKRPLRQLPDGMRHLLATHQREFEVKGMGEIVYDVDRRKLRFWDERLAPYAQGGRRILGKWNIEEPELLHCLPVGGEPFTLKHREQLSSHESRENMKQTARDRQACVNVCKQLFDTMKHPIRASVQRDGEATAEQQRTAEVIAVDVETHRAEKRETKRQAALVKAYHIVPEHPAPDAAAEASRDLWALLTAGGPAEARI